MGTAFLPKLKNSPSAAFATGRLVRGCKRSLLLTCRSRCAVENWQIPPRLFPMGAETAGL